MHTRHVDEGAPSASIPEGALVLDPLAEARALIADSDRVRTEACAQEIEAVLAKYGMRLDVTPAQITLTPA